MTLEICQRDDDGIYRHAVIEQGPSCRSSVLFHLQTTVQYPDWRKEQRSCQGLLSDGQRTWRASRPTVFLVRLGLGRTKIFWPKQ